MADPRADVRTTDRAIKNYYNELAGQTRAGVGATQAGFSQAASRAGGIYDQMTSDLQAQANATGQGLTDRFNALGIGAATDSATNNLRGQLNQAMVSAARRRAAAVSGLNDQAVAYRTAGLEGVNNIQREATQVRTDARTQLSDAILQLEAAQAQAKGQYDIQKLQGEIELQQMQQQMRAAAARARGGGGGRSGSPLDLLRAQLMGLEIQEKMQSLEMGPDTPWNREGQGGLNRFLDAPSDYWENQAGPRFRAGLEDLINYSFAQANNPASIASGRDDPYTIAMGNLNRQAPDYLEDDALRQALQIYFG